MLGRNYITEINRSKYIKRKRRFLNYKVALGQTGLTGKVIEKIEDRCRGPLSVRLKVSRKATRVTKLDETYVKYFHE